MPPPFHKQKTYGTARRGGTARQNAFRGSVRAWDAQRNRPSGGLLRQRPTDPRADKENAADIQSSRPPAPKPVTSGFDSDLDIDGEDSFVLESPPESPLADRISTVSLSTQAIAPVKTCFQSERRLSRPPSAEKDVEIISSMPEPQPRRPLAPKTNSSLNVLANRQASPSKGKFTPQKPTPKSKKAKGKRKGGKKKAPNPAKEVKEEETAQVQDVPASDRTTSQSDLSPPTPQQAVEEEAQIEQSTAATPLPLPSTPARKNNRPSVARNIEAPPADSSTRSPITLEQLPAETPSSPREIEAGADVSSAFEELAAEHHPVPALDDNGSASDADREHDVDEAEVLSPKQRAELRKQARKRRGRKSDSSALTDGLSSRLQSLAIGTPVPTPAPTPKDASSVGTSTLPTVTPAPSSTAASSVYAHQPQDITPLAPESEVFNLLRCCEVNRLMTFEEYLRGISPDFSRVKKIGESSFAQVFIHRRDDGRPVVLKLVPLDEEQNAKEVMQELKITRSLSPLDGFIKYLGCQVLSGGIPQELETAWATWEQKHNPETYTPSRGAFYGVEFHAVIALEDGGCSLEDCRWKTWDVPLEIFRQTLQALAKGEAERRFEHRDLHGGNLLVRDLAREREVEAPVEDTNTGRNVELGGFEELKVTVIDYTLSRADVPDEDGVAFLDIDEDTFMAHGLYQFEIYRMMREELRAYHAPGAKLNWQTHCPRTNVVWLHFLTKILLRTDDGRRNGGKLHIVKPRAGKKNAFELACRESLMRLHDELNWGGDERPVRSDFGGAVDIARWCEDVGVFRVLEEERERRVVARGGGGEVGVRRTGRRVTGRK
ncbi:Serine/threonine-protein kinase [Drechslerella dactyloides]|uniref:non-specific serine/threonine protein kinase n=1 Tax=Drechslerella dactyloides TaxID=74499 RepID=A0AAD6IWQ5_DREDA|nr:Serine/threonine-protein kinase [Drechslerella dactyloides]